MQTKLKPQVELVVDLTTVPAQPVMLSVDTLLQEIRSTILAGNALRVKTGALLIQVKQQLPHGAFRAWCSENLPDVSEKSIYNWMELATSDESVKITVLSEVKKLESMTETQAAIGGAQSGITKRTIERQEAKIEKLIAKMSPPPGPAPAPAPAPEPAVPQTPKEERPTQPTAAHMWDPFHKEWYVPEPKPQQQQQQQQRAKIETPYLDKKENAQFELARAFTIVLHTDTPEARKLMKQFFSSAFHPDNGKVKKDGSKMSNINHALTTLERK